ncbi:MAG TPA: hypothetical protein VK866_06780 [Acidimicrobiales bacterium]|nr:hypothetical protein [Acidimicrobiales bacterium]
MCDTLVALDAATGGHGTRFAKTSDRPVGEAQPLVWLAPRVDTRPVRATHVEVPPHPGPTFGVLGTGPAWQWGLEMGVSTAGVAAGNEAIFTRLDPRSAPTALTGLDLVRLVLERAGSAAEGVAHLVDLLEEPGQGGPCHESGATYWSSFLVADRDDAFVVETSGPDVAVLAVERSWAISNRTTIAAFDAEHRHPRQPVERTVDPRLAVTRDALAAEPVTAAALIAAQRDHRGVDGYSVCMHVPGDQETTAALVADLAPERPLVRVALGSPCRSVYVPLRVGRAVGSPPDWARWSAGLARLDPSARAALEAELDHDGVVTGGADDDGWADEAWRRLEAAIEAGPAAGPTTSDARAGEGER